ncbi:MAG: toxin [Bacteroidota bacterium]
MADLYEVEAFLKEFKFKMKIFDILFRDERKKNTQALLSLEITPIARKEIIQNITATDYCEGPLNDTLYGIASMWVFGKHVKKTELYIKLSMGVSNSQVLCISFHDTQHDMTYPLKK